MLSIKVCKKYLGKYAEKMNEIEIEEIRDFLYSLAHTFVEHYEQEKKEDKDA